MLREEDEPGDRFRSSGVYRRIRGLEILDRHLWLSKRESEKRLRERNQRHRWVNGERKTVSSLCPLSLYRLLQI